ncbi:MAG: hypothetical protein ABI567_00050 [Gammaproteobacteria bacterium]
MTTLRREALVIAMVFLHLFAVPCATAMVLMPADADCEHCLTSESAGACLVSSVTAGAAIEDLAIGSGRVDPPFVVLKVLSPAPAAQAAVSYTTFAFSRSVRPGAQPLYLLLGQFRI